ncbi:MAG TPA: DUF4347 domain-containing protein, partial [Wenzhouxiangellaceae bacterium]|nr:DUF4347 domain-containing protein [Wenzhouxiangellaceae bacterium]
MKHTFSSRPASNRLKSAIDLGIRAMRHKGTWAAASLAVGSGASAAPVLEPARTPALAPIDRPSAVTRSLVLVDPAVERADILLSDLPPNASVVELPRDQDPIAAIGRTLRMHRDIGEIHVLSHGDAGALRLGAQRIDAAALEARSDQLRGWFADRNAAPVIVLYGCSAGAGEAGLSLINTLARLTGAAVSASDDATGRPADGGDWIFERSTGLAARSPIFGEAARAEFEGLLATFTVANTDDAGAGSLRQAIIDANNAPGPDVVDATGISGTITLATGQIDITDEVEINGPGQASLTVSGNDASRIFGIYADTAISDVTLTAGSTPGDGGAVNSASGSTLTITGVTISDSYAGNDGGGIAQEEGELIIRNSTITGNTADSGGGIRLYSDYSTTRLEITNTTISNNTAQFDGGGIYIQVEDYGGTFEISDSTISGNTAGDQGGGITLYADSVYAGAVSAGDLTISNSTISNNTAATGGGVFVYGEEDVGDILISGSTIRDNVAQGTNIFRGGGG